MVMRMNEHFYYTSATNFIRIPKPLGPVLAKAPAKKPMGFAKVAGAAVKKAAEIAASPIPYERPVTPWTISTTEFPMCCGSKILKGFPGSFDAYMEKQMDKMLEAYPKMHKTGMTFAVLAEYQTKYRDVFLKHGWVSTGAFNNPVHNSKLEGFYLDHKAPKNAYAW